MKIQKHAISLACLAALGLAGSAHAVQVAGEALEVYGNMYPQYQSANFSDAAVGAANSTMTAGNVTPGTVAAKTKDGTTQVNWVNSYIGFKGQKAFGDIRAGYDIQGVLMADRTLTTSNEFGEARDAFLFFEHKAAGTFQIGQMDTIYKEFGDKVRLLGTSSGNFTSTSSMVSGVTWKSPVAVGVATINPTTGVVTPANATTTGTAAAGTTSFNTRINGQIRWLSPNWSGVQVGYSYRPDPVKSATSDASLSAMGVRWSNATYYVALGTETHNDYRAVSGRGVTEAATKIFNNDARSKDTAVRLSGGYTAEKFRIGVDVSSLEYTEAGANVGKFESYKTTGWQVTAEYAVTPQVTVGGNYGRNAAGTCSLVGGTACSTDGLGGTMMSLGGRYDYDKSVGFFALLGRTTVGDGAVLASGNVGGPVSNLALGLQVKF